jgi:hypothetical protein
MHFHLFIGVLDRIVDGKILTLSKFESNSISNDLGVIKKGAISVSS